MNYSGCKVTVLGLGSFGGGVGAVRFLAERGARVIVTDLKSADDLRESVALIADLPHVTLHLGGHRDEDFQSADLVVVSPAVPRDNHFVQLARQRGIPLSSEMNLFWQHQRGRVAAITGSNGKSTTTALLNSLLKVNENRRCWLGGNIGRSLLPHVDEIQPDDWVILELSSFQLEDLEPLQPAPEVAIVTNFSPNHLDRHGTLAEYRAAKQNLLRWQSPDQIAILNRDDADVWQWPSRAKRFGFGLTDHGDVGLFAAVSRPLARAQTLFRDGPREESYLLGEWLRLPGVHNLQNALAACCAARLIGASSAELEAGVRNFAGLPHRLEFVAEKAGLRFYNDSKATTPAAASLALAAFDQPIVLLAGGYNKHLDLAGLARDIVQRARAVALIGETAPHLQRLLDELDPLRTVARQILPSLPEACQWATQQAQSGDVVLLSPGCASYDWFKNYEARGGAFREWVQEWPGC